MSDHFIAEPKTEARTLSIVLVEDETGVRNILQKKFKRLIPDCKIEAFSSARQALRHINEEGMEIDLIISDLNLIDQAQSGLWLLEHVRQLDSTKTVPFLMVSADESRENKNQAMQLKASAYFPKRFGADLLAEVGVGLASQRYEGRKARNNLSAFVNMRGVELSEQTMTRIHEGEKFHLVSTKQWEGLRSTNQGMRLLSSRFESLLNQVELDWRQND